MPTESHADRLRYLPLDHPKFLAWLAASQLEPDERARQLSAQLVATCPRSILHDPEACAEHLQGPAAAHAVNAMAAHAERDLVRPHLEAADLAADRYVAANDRADELGRLRKNLPDEPVEGPTGRMTRAQNRAQLSQNQRIGAQRELAGDREHLRLPGAGWKGHAVAGISAVLEIVVTVRIFNVDLTHIVWLTFLPWLAVTAGLGLFNTYVSAYLGRRRRDSREIRLAATDLNTLSLSQARYPKK